RVLPADLHGCPVLVVDDNGTSRRMLSALLTSWHLHPVAVDSGPAALTALAQGGDALCRLLVLDVEMPAMDGLTLAERIRHMPGYAGTPILLLASRDLATMTARARALARTRCLLKPVTPGELWEAIQGMLHGQAAADPPWPTSPPPAPTHRPSLCCL